MACAERVCPFAILVLLAGTRVVRSVPLPFYHTREELHDAVVLLTRRCGGASATFERRSSTGLGSNRTEGLDVITLRPRAGGASNASASLRGGTKRHGNGTLRAMLVFGEHARELISSESGLHFLRALCEGTPARAERSLSGVAELRVVVNANPQGRRAAEDGEWCRRTNEDLVDLNRNWGSRFSARSDVQMTRPGPASFSEPETRVLRDLAREFRPHLFLSVHSGGLLLGTPFGYDNAIPAPPSFQRMVQLLKPISDKYCGCPVGGLADFMRYRAPGNAVDYIYGELGVPFAFTWEIYANDDEAQAFRERRAREVFVMHDEVDLREYGAQSNASRREENEEEHEMSMETDADDKNLTQCFSFFNPTSLRVYQDVLQRWTSAYVDLIAATAREVALEDA